MRSYVRAGIGAAGGKSASARYDQRFAHLKGFRTFDLYRPEWLGEEFDLIICDPPFFKVSLAQLFTAMRLLARNQYHQPMLISYLSRRKDNLLGTFARFNLVETAYYPVYQTVQRSEHNQIEFFGNLDANLHQQLKLDTSNPQ